MDLDKLEFREEILNVLTEEAQISVWILTLDDNRFYISKDGKFQPIELDFESAMVAVHPDDVLNYRTLYGDVLSGKKKSCRGNFRMKNEEGGYNTFRIHFIGHTNPDGKMDYMLCTVHDISGYVKEREEKVRLLSKYEYIFNNLPYAVAAFDNSGKVIEANELAVTLSRDKFNCNIYETNIINFPTYTKEQQRFFLEHKPFTYTLRHQLKADEVLPLLEENHDDFFIANISYVPVFDEKKNFIINLIIVKDITKEDLATQENIHNQQKLRFLDRIFNLSRIQYNPATGNINIQESVTDGTYLTKSYTAEEYLRIIHPEDRDIFLKLCEKASHLPDEILEAKYRVHFPERKEYRHIAIALLPDHDKEGKVISYSGKRRDRTQEVLEKEKLEDNIKQISVLNTKYQISLWEYDMENDLFVSNNEHSDNPFYRTIKLDEYMKTLHPEDVPKVKQFAQEMRNHTFDMEPYVLRHRLGKNQTYIYLHYVPECVRNEKGEIERYIFICRNVTKEREQLLQLTRYAEHTHHIYQNCGITLWTYNPATRIYTNIDPYLEEYKPTISADQLLNYTHPEDKENLRQIISLADALDPKIVEYHCRNKWETDYCYYRVIRIPFFDEDGDLTEYGIIRIDETEKKRTNEMLRFSQEVGSIGSWTYNLYTDKPYFTDEMFRLLGIDVCEPTTQLFRSCVHPKDIKRYDEIMRTYLPKGENFSFTMRYLMPDGSIKWMDDRCICRKDENGKPIEYYGTLTDITELHKAKMKAEESDQLKSAFLANMSHEIRTPLNAIVGFSDLLTTVDDPQEKEEFTNIIHSNNEQLLMLINDILDLSKLESNSVTFSKDPFDVELMMKEVYVSYLPKFKDSAVELVYQPTGKSVTLCQDRQRLIEVLTNFINNAIKYTSSGSITLSYKVIDKGVKFMVKDTGIGIPAEASNKVFNRFEKLGSLVKGTGLGLSICKVLAETMGGRIGVKSTVGEGSTFWFWIGMK